MGRDHLDVELSKPIDRRKEIEVEPSALSAKMANSISESNRLHKTYAPAPVAVVRDPAGVRKLGRRKLREQKPHESMRAPAQKVSAEAAGG